MLFPGPSGFAGAPLTKVLWSAILGFSVAVLLTDSSSFFAFQPAAVMSGEVWRLITSCAYASQPLELFASLFVVYGCGRMSERHLGSNKFSVLVLVTLGAYLAVEVASITLASMPLIARGPHALVAALVALYATDVPPTRRFRLFNLPLHNKWFTYVLAFQCFTAGYPSSVLGAIAGAVAGLAYRSRGLGMRDWKLPARFAGMCSAVWMPILGADQPAAVVATPAAALGAGRQLGGRQAQAQPQAAGPRYVEQLLPTAGEGGVMMGGDGVSEEEAALQAAMLESQRAQQLQQQQQQRAQVEPDPGAVETLVAMGFEERLVREALSRCNNDITMATNALLDH